MKKFVCMLLVVVLAFALCCTAFAAPSPAKGGQTGTPTGSTPAGKTAPTAAKTATAGAAGGAGKESAQTGYDTVVLVAAATVLTLGAGVCFVNVRKHA